MFFLVEAVGICSRKIITHTLVHFAERETDFAKAAQPVQTDRRSQRDKTKLDKLKFSNPKQIKQNQVIAKI